MLTKVLSDIDFKDSKKGAGTFTGYASVFGGVDSYGDTIQKGAYAKTLKDRKYSVKMLYQHRPDNVIGKWTDIKEDNHGLKVEGEFTPGHSLANDVYALAKHGAIDGMSIGYDIAKGGAEEQEDGTTLLTQLDLGEVSIVTFPADREARMDEVKSYNQDDFDELIRLKDFERFLRDSGPLSKQAATAFLSRFKQFTLGDPDSTCDETKKAIDNAISKTSDIGTALEQLKASISH